MSSWYRYIKCPDCGRGMRVQSDGCFMPHNRTHGDSKNPCTGSQKPSGRRDIRRVDREFRKASIKMAAKP